MLKVVETADTSPTLFHSSWKAYYHSVHGAVQESNYVFIQNGLMPVIHRTKNIHLLEVGLGTGLNCFLSALAIRQWAPHFIQYVAIEKFPLEKLLFNTLSEKEPFCRHKELFLTIHSERTDVFLQENFQLIKIIEDAKVAIQNIPENFLQLIYYDAFAPSTQPEMWEKEIFEILYTKMQKDAVLVTYCAQGQFKRHLKAIGFKVETLAGAGKKREMTRAIKS